MALQHCSAAEIGSSYKHRVQSSLKHFASSRKSTWNCPFVIAFRHGVAISSKMEVQLARKRDAAACVSVS